MTLGDDGGDRPDPPCPACDRAARGQTLSTGPGPAARDALSRPAPRPRFLGAAGHASGGGDPRQPPSAVVRWPGRPARATAGVAVRGFAVPRPSWIATCRSSRATISRRTSCSTCSRRSTARTISRCWSTCCPTWTTRRTRSPSRSNWCRPSAPSGGPFIGTGTGFGLRGGVAPGAGSTTAATPGERAGGGAAPQDSVHAVFDSPARPQPAQPQLRRQYRDANTDTSQSRRAEQVGSRRACGTAGRARLARADRHVHRGQRGNEPDNAPGIGTAAASWMFAEASLARKGDPAPVRRAGR